MMLIIKIKSLSSFLLQPECLKGHYHIEQYMPPLLTLLTLRLSQSYNRRFTIYREIK